MKTKRNTLISVILAISLMIPSLISCAQNNDNNNESTANQTENSASETEAEAKEPTLEELYPLPKEKYDGRSFDMMVLRTGYWGQDYNDLWFGEDSGESIDSASFNRRLAVEKLLDVNMTQTESPDTANQIYALYNANDDTYELIQSRPVMMMPMLASNGVLHNIASMDKITLDAPWYNHNMYESSTIAGQLYMLGGDGVITDKTGIEAMMFNKKLVAEYSIPDFYTTVSEGKWTLDKMAEYGRLITNDVNGDGKLDKKDDSFGLIAEDFFGWAFMVSSGYTISDKDENDIPYFTAGEEGAVNAMLKIQNLMYDETLRDGSDYEAEDYTDVFSTNRALFHPNVLSTIVGFRDMDADFGIIPLPKYDEAQSGYITTLSPFVSRFVGFPITCSDTDFIGTVFDVMSRYGTDTIMKAYYDVLLTGKVARDEESVSMLDMIFDSVVLDIGATYNWANCWFTYQQYISGRKENWASTWKAIEKAAQKSLEKTVEQYTALPEA